MASPGVPKGLVARGFPMRAMNMVTASNTPAVYTSASSIS